MKQTIDMEALLAPIPGENPAGENLRYTPIYEEIKEARRADDPLDRGDWQRELKRADWPTVIALATEALAQKSKDLQLAAWLVEALANTSGWDGVTDGLTLMKKLLQTYWETLYPEIEEGDLEYRVGPVELLNERLPVVIKDIPLTDPRSTPGYSWLKWQESRTVGYEADTRNRYGDTDEEKKRTRDERIAEGKLTAEEFDAALASTPAAFFVDLAQKAAAARQAFETFDSVIDERFGKAAPRLAELKEAIEECERVITKYLKEKKPADQPEEAAAPSPAAAPSEPAAPMTAVPPGLSGSPRPAAPPGPSILATQTGGSRSSVGSGGSEEALWAEVVHTMQTAGMKTALGQILGAVSSAPSVREKNRLRLLMAKLCLKADRPDLARPIAEELHALIEEIHLDRWESPLWIADVLDVLYQCLTRGDPSDDDLGRARALFQRLCTTDVTKAVSYKMS